jgi:hypothetical protein
MNILFGDPFYHNIIYHLSIKDLYNLIKTCTHFNHLKTYIKIFTVNDIKHNLSLSLGNKYYMFKIKYQSLFKEIEKHDNYLIKFYNKKYSYMLNGESLQDGPNNSTLFSTLFHSFKLGDRFISINDSVIDVEHMYLYISVSSSTFGFAVYGFKNDCINKIKSNFKKLCDDKTHTYLIENNDLALTHIL